jgi:hypothetical protein
LILYESLLSLHLTLLLTYSLLLLLLGLWIGRYVKGAGDFFVAGRRLGPGLIFATLLAANIGAGSTVGAAGLGYREGLSAWWWNGSAGIGSLLLALWIGPRIWREASRRNYLTVGDFLEDRYGRGVRGIVAGLLWLGTLAILAGQFLGMSRILEVVAGLPKPAGCALGGILVTGYFAAGGLFGAAWINVVQLTVKLVGFAIALPLILSAAGGVGALQAASSGSVYGSFWGPSSAPLLFLMVPAFMISPGLLQKAYGARDERAVRLGVGDFVLKPWDNEKLKATMEAACRLSKSNVEISDLKKKEKILKQDVNRSGRLITGRSAAMKDIMNLIDKIASTDASVIITGENGTGKEMIAREIHRRSKRYNELFVLADLSTLSESLFESELFGHKKGSFTNAYKAEINMNFLV